MKTIVSKSEKKTARQFRKKISDYLDLKLLFTVIALISIGLLSIFSATYDSGSSTYFYRQLFFAILGLPVIVLIALIPEKWINFNSIFIYLTAIAFLIAVLFFGQTVSGTKGWLDLGVFRFQPAELAKISVLLLVARFLNQKGRDIQNLRDLLVVVGLFLLPVFLVLLQPDVGSSTVLVVMLYGILFWAGFDIYVLYFLFYIPFAIVLSLFGIWYMVGGFIFFIITSILFKKNFLQTVVFISFIFVVSYFSEDLLRMMPQNTQDRIEIFRNPDSDPLNKGYNVMQSVLAVGSGGVTGKGFLKGSQTQLRYIPEQRTDFIFCVPTEEFGFMGGAAVIILYAYLLFRILKISIDTNSDFLRLIAFGICAVFFYHAVINLGMVMRIMPVMGIPLPFMSYGGTALLVNMAMIGLLMNGHRNKKKAYQ